MFDRRFIDVQHQATNEPPPPTKMEGNAYAADGESARVDEAPPQKQLALARSDKPAVKGNGKGKVKAKATPQSCDV